MTLHCALCHCKRQRRQIDDGDTLLVWLDRCDVELVSCCAICIRRLLSSIDYNESINHQRQKYTTNDSLSCSKVSLVGALLSSSLFATVAALLDTVLLDNAADALLAGATGAQLPLGDEISVAAAGARNAASACCTSVTYTVSFAALRAGPTMCPMTLV